MASKSMGGGGRFFQDQATLRARWRLRVVEIKKRLVRKFPEQKVGAAMARNPGKPPITIVDPASGISPPRKLGQHGLSLWNAVQSAYRIDDVGGIELLAQVCAAQDRVEALAEAINRDGETLHTRNGPKAHPALRDELACRAFIVRTLERLGLNVETIKPMGRLSYGFGWKGRDADE